MHRLANILCGIALLLTLSCGRRGTSPDVEMEYARWFRNLPDNRVVVLSPDGGRDTLQGPVQRLVCMSSSYVGYLEAIGQDSLVAGVSGLAFLGNGFVAGRAREVGYDAALDYETILRLQPDLVLAYAVSGAQPPYLAKLRELGIRTVVLSEHLENHPLARAEYVKLFGALSGHLPQADSVFAAVRDRYQALVQPQALHKVLINIPYADEWFIPGADNYMTQLVRDAGGCILGAAAGKAQSSIIDLETAYAYAQEADFWLHPGWCRTREQLRSVHPLFAHFPVLDKAVWNNTLQVTPGGGNRYWETGPARPDLILEDLVAIFSGAPGTLHYYVKVE